MSLPDEPFALMVGTIEPRKNHRLVLAAFEALWAQGSALQLVLVGAPGWCSDSLLAQLESHAELGRRLHWFRHLPDSALHALYSTASTLVFASLDEGFGLPLAEAAFLGCPVLAADVAVLREVGGDWPTWLPVDGVAQWAAALQALTPPITKRAPLLTWEQTAQQLLGHLAALAAAPVSC